MFLLKKARERQKEILEMMEFHYLDCGGDGFMGVCLYPAHPVLSTKHVWCFVYPLYFSKFVFFFKERETEGSEGRGRRVLGRCSLWNAEQALYAGPLGAELSNQID